MKHDRNEGLTNFIWYSKITTSFLGSSNRKKSCHFVGLHQALVHRGRGRSSQTHLFAPFLSVYKPREHFIFVHNFSANRKTQSKKQSKNPCFSGEHQQHQKQDALSIITIIINANSQNFHWGQKVVNKTSWVVGCNLPCTRSCNALELLMPPKECTEIKLSRLKINVFTTIMKGVNKLSYSILY